MPSSRASDDAERNSVDRSSMSCLRNAMHTTHRTAGPSSVRLRLARR
jgi:hypothetical protein